MKAVAIEPGSKEVRFLEQSEPQCQTPFDVKIRILYVGVCGTDLEQVESGHAEIPAGSQHLVIGHEMLGEVVEVGARVTRVQPGDQAVVTVRRGCGDCVPCRNNRSDLCYTGNYKERGIKELHGFETEYVVDDEQYIVRVPETLGMLGVLAEPMSIAEKAIDEAVTIQTARLPNVNRDHRWLNGKKAMVAGIGAIGLLAAVALRLRGAEVIGLDIVDADNKRVEILKAIGGTYIDGRTIETIDIDDEYGEVDFLFEATGVPDLGFQLIDAVGINGIYVMTGIPGGTRPVCFSGTEIMKQIVLKNQIILGSVNASSEHFAMALKDMEKAREKYGDVLEQFITSKIPYNRFMDAISQRGDDDIKTLVDWTK